MNVDVSHPLEIKAKVMGSCLLTSFFLMLVKMLSGSILNDMSSHEHSIQTHGFSPPHGK